MTQEVNDIDATLKERGTKYGKFSTHAAYTYSIKAIYHLSPNWSKMSPSQKESLDMIAHKIGRILNGDPNYADSWVDIAGYSKLVADELSGNSK